MDAVLIERWNSRVTSRDIVYHLGDFCLGSHFMARKYFSQLKGRIIVLANHSHHDKRWLPTDIGPTTFYSASNTQVWTTLPLLTVEKEWPEFGKIVVENPISVLFRTVLVLCHYPLESWDRSHYGSYHLHGHSHGNTPAKKFRIDVGVDCTDFYPLSLKEVGERINESYQNLAD